MQICWKGSTQTNKSTSLSILVIVLKKKKKNVTTSHWCESKGAEIWMSVENLLNLQQTKTLDCSYHGEKLWSVLQILSRPLFYRSQCVECVVCKWLRKRGLKTLWSMHYLTWLAVISCFFFLNGEHPFLFFLLF